MPAVLVWILPLHSASTFSVLLVRVEYLSNYQFLPQGLRVCVCTTGYSCARTRLDPSHEHYTSS